MTTVITCNLRHIKILFYFSFTGPSDVCGNYCLFIWGSIFKSSSCLLWTQDQNMKPLLFHHVVHKSIFVFLCLFRFFFFTKALLSIACHTLALLAKAGFRTAHDLWSDVCLCVYFQKYFCCFSSFRCLYLLFDYCFFVFLREVMVAGPLWRILERSLIPFWNIGGFSNDR